jgi:ABC-type transport system involved in multi-copper enzyme maturation permease subunit
MSAVPVIVGYALRESLRRRVFAVVLVLTLGFLALYGFGAAEAFHDVRGFAEGSDAPVDAHELTGSTLFGLSMFATLFLGAVLAVFLTLSVVRGDAERGLLQPLVVRPVGRPALLLARFAAAALVCTVYVLVVYAAAMVITGLVGDWWPDRIVTPGLGLAGGVTIIAALSLLGSVFLSTTANGIAIFMVFGAGLTAGLLAQIGQAIGSHTLRQIGRTASWVLPFEALYQQALSLIVADARGLTEAIVRLGPFGGAQDSGTLLWPWAGLYLIGVGVVAIAFFARRDL